MRWDQMKWFHFAKASSFVRHCFLVVFARSYKQTRSLACLHARTHARSLVKDKEVINQIRGKICFALATREKSLLIISLSLFHVTTWCTCTICREINVWQIYLFAMLALLVSALLWRPPTLLKLVVAQLRLLRKKKLTELICKWKQWNFSPQKRPPSRSSPPPYQCVLHPAS